MESAEKEYPYWVLSDQATKDDIYFALIEALEDQETENRKWTPGMVQQLIKRAKEKC